MSPLLERLREALAPRYEVESEVASGGMGTVFLARDTTLDRRVAIKVLRPEETSSSAAQRLFREARILASLSHAHVVSIFDAGEVDDCFYFVMDYVEGETLEQRLARGPLSVEETTRLADNLLDALSAAHGQGIIHRDVKPSNVFVQEDHFLLGDFGIAKKLETKTGLTEPDRRVGTPGYMAPEQYAGDEVTAATDIYAAGMVLYEAATGKQWSIFKASQMDWSAVPSRFAKVLRRALEWEPEDRWPDAASFRDAVVGAEHRPRGRAAVISAIAAAAVTAVIAGALLLRPEASGLDPNKVVVAPFENLTGDDSLDVVGRMAADWITQGIARTGLVDVVPSTAALYAEKSTVAEAGILPDLDRALGMAEATGAGTVVSGSYYREADSLRFQVQVTDASRGRLLSAPEPVSAPVEDKLQAIVELQQRVMGALGASLNPLLGERPAELIQPPQYDAYVEYAKGLELFAGFDYTEAAYRFHRAAALDSTFASAQLFLTFVYWQLEDLAKVDSITRLVERSRDRLTPADREFLDFMIAYTKSDYHGAYEAARRRLAIGAEPVWLWIFAIVAEDVSRPGEAVEALERIDPELFEGKTFEPWYYLYLAVGYHLLGEYEKELSVVRRGRQLHPESFRLRRAEMRALAALGSIEEMRRAVDECFSLPLEKGWLPTEHLKGLAFHLHATGHPQVAQEVAERALAWYRSQTPAEVAQLTGRSSWNIKYDLAAWLYWAGEYGEARLLWEELAQESPEAVGPLGWLGILAVRAGDRAEALRIDEELQRRSSSLSERAAVAAHLGERDRALALLQEMIANGAWLSVLHSWALEPLWDDPAFQQLLEPKG